ncbi:MAG: 5-(carboxyamino)imidazole ribonucleotide mutase [Candidatus Omnitrophica bacterium]|nr:5-(carboxyamino)imidazole ribonucleotide mutase [Candidatus Omnitrophota bacterium]MBI3021582.1 5-(carboxyamino)imidazole ribonucleotide mutase [Candidatus Omnitrophota bacterium]
MKRAVVGILMGSDSDWPVMEQAAKTLAGFGVPYEARVLSAHRSPDLVRRYVNSAGSRGIKVFIAGAGGAAHLAGVIAAQTTLPVIGVPMESKSLKGLDSLLSTLQMPPGVPVATVAIGSAANAAVLAVQCLALSDRRLQRALVAHKRRLVASTRRADRSLPRTSATTHGGPARPCGGPNPEPRTFAR